MEKILVFIPMYNCEKQIKRVIEQIGEEVQELVSEVLILDNGSKDLSVEVAIESIQKLSIKASIRRNVDNYNLGGSHKVAFNYAKENNFDYVIVLHGDDQGNIKDILPYIKNKEHQKVDCLLGSRFSMKSKLIGYSKLRIYANICFNIMYSVFSLKKVSDLGSGLNIYNVNFLKGDFYLKFPNTLQFNVYLLLYTIHNKFKIKFVPITWREDDQISNAKLVPLGIALIKIAFSYLFAKKSLLYKSGSNEEKIKYDSVVIGKNKHD